MTLNPQTAGQIADLEAAVAERARTYGVRYRPRGGSSGISEREAQQRLTAVQQALAEVQAVARLTASREQREKFVYLRQLLSQSPLTSLRRLIQGIGTLGVSGSIDPYGYDASFEQALKPLLDFLFYEYWRVEVIGLENVPLEGAAMLVANHAGLLPFDALMIRHAIRKGHHRDRKARFLIEDWFYRRAMLSIAMTRLGCVRASAENAEALLRTGDLIGVFPEGVQGVTKRFSQRYRVQRFGRGGSVRLAARHGVPIITTAVVGSEEIYPVLWESERLARVLGLDYLPLTPQFPLLGPLSLLPLPSAWSIQFAPPMQIKLPPESSAQYEIEMHQANERVRDAVQQQTMDLFASRRSSFWR